MCLLWELLVESVIILLNLNKRELIKGKIKGKGKHFELQLSL